MKIPPSSYQKLFDSILLEEFPEIDNIWVGKNWALGIITVKVYLKPADEQTGMISCHHLMRKLMTRMTELSQYFGGGGVCSLDIYFEDELLCHDAFKM